MSVAGKSEAALENVPGCTCQAPFAGPLCLVHVPAPLESFSRIVQLEVTASFNISSSPPSAALASQALSVLSEFLSIDILSLSHDVGGERRKGANFMITILSYAEDQQRLQAQLLLPQSAVRLHRLFAFYAVPTLQIQHIHVTCGQGYERTNTSGFSSVSYTSPACFPCEFNHYKAAYDDSPCVLCGVEGATTKQPENDEDADERRRASASWKGDGTRRLLLPVLSRRSHNRLRQGRSSLIRRQQPSSGSILLQISASSCERMGTQDRAVQVAEALTSSVQTIVAGLLHHCKVVMGFEGPVASV